MASFFSLLFGCESSTTCFCYEAQENQPSRFGFKFDPSDSASQQLVFKTMLHNIKDTTPWIAQLSYSGERRYAEKIKGIDLNLYGKNKNDAEYSPMPSVSPQVISNDIKNYYYYNPIAQPTKITFADYLYKSDYNKENTINYFWLDSKFKEIPDEIKADIVVRWDTGEVKFSTLLKRKEQYCSKPSNRPFG
jgi:hypothetical protein